MLLDLLWEPGYSENAITHIKDKAMLSRNAGVLGILMSGMLYSALIQAGDMGPISNSRFWRPFVTLTGGAAFTSDTGSVNNFPATDTIFTFFNYNPSQSTQTDSIFGALVGAEFIAHPNVLFQAGVGYYQPSSFNVNGIVTQGVDIPSSNQYAYQYSILSHQLLAEGKLLYNNEQRYHPYISGGLGLSWNESKNYTVTISPPFTTFSNQFANNTTTSFSWSVGTGVDVDLTKKVRLGVGYRFTDFGKAATGNGTIDDVLTTYALSQSHLYANIIEAQLTFEFM
jgi:hypothetical protein